MLKHFLWCWEKAPKTLGCKTQYVGLFGERNCNKCVWCATNKWAQIKREVDGSMVCYHQLCEPEDLHKVCLCEIACVFTLDITKRDSVKH